MFLSRILSLVFLLLITSINELRVLIDVFIRRHVELIGRIIHFLYRIKKAIKRVIKIIVFAYLIKDLIKLMGNLIT